jgi:hypothetical protein
MVNVNCLCYETTYLNEEVNCTEPPIIILILTPWEKTDQIGEQELLTEGEGLSTVDLLALTSLDQILLDMVNINDLCYETSYLNEEVNCT